MNPRGTKGENGISPGMVVSRQTLGADGHLVVWSELSGLVFLSVTCLFSGHRDRLLIEDGEAVDWGFRGGDLWGVDLLLLLPHMYEVLTMSIRYHANIISVTSSKVSWRSTDFCYLFHL